MAAPAEERRFAYLDLDVGGHLEKLSRAAAFVDATDTRYGWSSKDILRLGGSEIPRVADMKGSDHDWAGRGEIAVHPPPPGQRVVVELFPSASPQACENFLRLCRGREAGVGQCGKPLRYHGSRVHRVQRGFVIQGGDFVKGNGTGGESVWGKKFKDDKGGLQLQHAGPGVLSMGNSGKNSNTSQFFFTLAAAPQLDGKHVVFGRVVSGLDVLKYIEETVGTTDGSPTAEVLVTDCGDWVPGETPGQGYWLNVPDADAFAGHVPRFFARPRLGIVVPSPQVGARFEQAIRAAAAEQTRSGPGRGPCLRVAVLETGQEEDRDAAEETARQWLNDAGVDVLVLAPAAHAALEKKRANAPSAAGGENQAAKELVPDGRQIVVCKPTPVELGDLLRNGWWQEPGGPWLVSGSAGAAGMLD
uniref:peptidylprolyl isomerase n=1 Tax=Rhizochromulina marina TaxID=1034831 RepID=A0A7S2SLM7_9STRA